MAALGFTPEAVQAAVTEVMAKASAEPDQGLAIHPDNGPAVRLFLALQTQWRTLAISTMSRADLRRTGLDYGAIEPTARLLALDLDADLFARLRVLEVEALNAWGEEAARR